jgi:F0F1-type ATP synthase assembly protein I
MGPKEPAGRELGTGYKYVALGMTFAFAIVMFMGVGLVLDRLLGTSPWLLIAGAVGGTVLAFVWVLLKLRADEADYRREHPHKFDQK